MWKYAKGEWVLYFDSGDWMKLDIKNWVFDILIPNVYASRRTVNLIEHLCQMEDDRRRLRKALESIRDNPDVRDPAHSAATDALKQCYHAWRVNPDVPEGSMGRVYCPICRQTQVDWFCPQEALEQQRSERNRKHLKLMFFKDIQVTPAWEWHYGEWKKNLIEHFFQMGEERLRLRQALVAIRDNPASGDFAHSFAAEVLVTCYHTWVVNLHIPIGANDRVYCLSCGQAAGE